MSFGDLLTGLLSDQQYVIDEYAGSWRLRKIVDGRVVSSRVYDTRAEAEADAK